MNARLQTLLATAFCGVMVSACGYSTTGTSTTKGEIEGSVVTGPTCGVTSSASCSDSPVSKIDLVVSSGDRVVKTVKTSSGGSFDVPLIAPGEYEVSVKQGTSLQCTTESAPVVAAQTIEVVVRCN